MLRSYRWGHNTAEPDRDTDLAPRTTTRFACPHGHEFTVHFAANADIPTLWTCRQHGADDCRRINTATTTSAKTASARRGRPPRTHLVLLYERRTKGELEALLADTLTAMRRRGGARLGCAVIGGRPYSFRYDG